MTFGPYPAIVESIHDGDTMRLVIDLGFDVSVRSNCRVFGINAPELSTPEGKEALAYAQSILPLGTKVTVISHGWDKFGGRFDGSVAYGDTNFGQAMLDAGHAVVFKG